ncbi:MAG: NAD(P)H-dependent oxidoreductase, partial [Cyanobacteria bacterium P01_C01_bin.118]
MRSHTEIRPVDFIIMPGRNGDEGLGDEFPKVFDQIQSADILIFGIPAIQGQRSSQCQMVMERLQGICREQQDLATGQSPLYNKVVGVILVGDSWGSGGCLAQTCFELGQLGCVNPPYNTAMWCQPMDTEEGFMEAEGKKSITVNRDVRLLVEHITAMAHRLRSNPLQSNLKAINQDVQTMAKAAEAATDTVLLPQPIYTEDTGKGIHYKQVSKRIWTIMEAGRKRGFHFSVLHLDDK